MESQPQNPEFRNNPENFHPCCRGFTACIELMKANLFLNEICMECQTLLFTRDGIVAFCVQSGYRVAGTNSNQGRPCLIQTYRQKDLC